MGSETLLTKVTTTLLRGTLFEAGDFPVLL